MQKALRGLETGLCGFDDYQPLEGAPRAAIEAELVRPTPDRLLVAVQALREGFTVAEVQNFTHYDPWFLERFVEIVAAERGVIANGLPTDSAGLRRLKAAGFYDKRLAQLALKSANLRNGDTHLNARAQARGSGIVHDEVTAMTGVINATKVRALRHKQ